jgi:hypothetical protein
MRVHLFLAIWLFQLLGAGSQALAQSTPEGVTSQNASNKSLNAESFGNCSWNGSDDVSPCVQAAVDAAAKSAKAVHLPSGILLLSHPINLRSNVTLVGEPNRTVLKPTLVNNSKPVLLLGTNLAHVFVENLTFDGGGEDFQNANLLIDIAGSEDVVFKGVTVQNSRGAGAALHDGITQSGIRDSHFMHLGNYWKTTRNRADRLQGLVFCCGIGNSGNFAIGNYFEDIGLDALQFSEQSNFMAADNKFKLENNQHSLVQSGDFPAAIFPMNSVDSAILRNTISGAQGCGIDAPALRRSLISMNKVSDSHACGIGLFEGYDKSTQTSNIILTDNIIQNNVHWKESPFKGGITIAAGAPSQITISRNTVTDTQTEKTQIFGIEVVAGTKVSDLKIDKTNMLTGNALATLDHANFNDRVTKAGHPH